MHGRSGKTSDAGPHLLPCLRHGLLLSISMYPVLHGPWDSGFSYLCIEHWYLRCVLRCWALHECWEFKLKSLRVHRKHYPPNHLPSRSPAFHLHFFNFEWLKVLYHILSTLREFHKMYLDHIVSRLLPRSTRLPICGFLLIRDYLEVDALIFWLSPLSPAFLEPWV